MSMYLTTPWIILAIAGFCAGVVNVVAGGGGFLTFPALLLTGLDPRAANITSTVGLYPMQVTTGYAGRKHLTGTPHLSFRTLMILSLFGGAIGAGLLLCTSSQFFGKLVPWLVLFATAMFAIGSFRKTKAADARHRLGKIGSIIVHFLISIYVGYYGGGAGFLMLASLTMAGMPVRPANAAKIILVTLMNTSALIIFLFSKEIYWMQALVVCIASEIGSHVVGVRLLNAVNDRVMRIGIIAFGTALSVWLFVRA